MINIILNSIYIIFLCYVLTCIISDINLKRYHIIEIGYDVIMISLVLITLLIG